MRSSSVTLFCTHCPKADKMGSPGLSQIRLTLKVLVIYLSPPSALTPVQPGCGSVAEHCLVMPWVLLAPLRENAAPHALSSLGCSCTSPSTSSTTSKGGLTQSAFLRSPTQSSLPVFLTGTLVTTPCQCPPSPVRTRSSEQTQGLIPSSLLSDSIS